MITATDGGTVVDSNVGTEAELTAEIAAETPRAVRRGRLTEPKAPAVVPDGSSAQADGDQGGDDDADAAASSTVAADAASEAGKTLGKKKKSLQARIDEITTERHKTAAERDQARAEAQRLQNELDELKGVRRPATKDKPAAKIVGGVPLDAERFPKFGEWIEKAPADANELEDWVDARDAWKDARAEEKTAAKAAETATRSAASAEWIEIADAYNARIAPVLKKDPEFYKKVDPELLKTKAASAMAPGERPGFLNFIVEQAFKSETPEQTLLWLSEPATLRRLATLKPDVIIREFAKIESRYRTADDSHTGPSAGDDDDDNASRTRQRRGSADADDDDTATSQASPPVKPVRGSSSQHSADQEPDDDASDDEWYRWEQRQKKSAGRSSARR